MENIFGSNVKKLLLMFLISPYVLSESYSCTNELANAAWEKQVVFKRNGDDFISTTHSAFSINNKDFPMSEFNWEIYAEDSRGIFLVSQNGLIKRQRGAHGRDEDSQQMNVVYLNKTIYQLGYAKFDIDTISQFEKILRAKGSCLIIKD